MTKLEDLENAVAFLESKLVPYSKLEETWRAIGQMARAFVEYEKEKLKEEK